MGKRLSRCKELRKVGVRRVHAGGRSVYRLTVFADGWGAYWVDFYGRWAEVGYRFRALPGAAYWYFL